MNITIDELSAAYEKLRLPLSLEELEQEKKNVANIVAREQLYLKNSAKNLCSNVTPKGSLSQLRDEAKRTLRMDMEEELACSLTDKLLLVTSQNTVDVIDKRKVTDIRKIGKESVMGNVYRGKVDGVDGVFLFKLSNFDGKTGNDLMIHELVVGLQLNELRAQGIPNFCFTYGSFSCGPPDENKNISICGEGDPVTYVMYEDFENAITAEEYMKNASPQQVLSMIFQVTMSLSCANNYFSSLKGASERYPFTHYDLHAQNVMMRRLPEDVFQIPYSSANSEIFYITADSVATIIDYGSAYIDGYGEPLLNIKANGQSNIKSLPIHDVFKFICSIASSYEGKNVRVWKLLETALRFFTNENLDQFLERARQDYFSLPDVDRYKEYSIGDFINHLAFSINSYDSSLVYEVYSALRKKDITLINTHRMYQQKLLTYSEAPKIERKIPVSETLQPRTRNKTPTTEKKDVEFTNNLQPPVDPKDQKREKIKKRGSYIASRTGTIMRKRSNVIQS